MLSRPLLSLLPLAAERKFHFRRSQVAALIVIQPPPRVSALRPGWWLTGYLQEMPKHAPTAQPLTTLRRQRCRCCFWSQHQPRSRRLLMLLLLLRRSKVEPKTTHHLLSRQAVLAARGVGRGAATRAGCPACPPATTGGRPTAAAGSGGGSRRPSPTPSTLEPAWSQTVSVSERGTVATLKNKCGVERLIRSQDSG